MCVLMSSGYGEFGISPSSGKGIDDSYRIDFIQGYIEGILQSVRYCNISTGYNCNILKSTLNLKSTSSSAVKSSSI